MTISYKWLSEYLPVKVEPQRLSEILTSIGLEVESMKPYEAVKGGFKGLVIGEIMECVKHPEADKLKLTKVSSVPARYFRLFAGPPMPMLARK
jgi:phenylalanyl-tRNA synthetase beta chain